MSEAKQPALSLLIFTGSALALWWLFRKFTNPEEKTEKKNIQKKCFAEPATLELKENKPILEELMEASESKKLYKMMTPSNGEIYILSSKGFIELMDIARDIQLLKPVFDVGLVLKEIREEQGLEIEEEKKVKKEFLKTCGAYNTENQTLNKNILIEVEKLEFVLRCEESSNKPFSPHRFFTMACTNIISLLILGCRFKYKSKRLQSLINMVEIHHSCLNMMGNNFEKECPYHNPRFSKNKKTIKNNFKDFMEFIDREVENHKKTFNPSKYRDPIDIFLKSLSQKNSGAMFSRHGLDTTIIEFFLKGSRQISTHLLWTLYCLVEHPSVQDRCHNEIDQFIGQHRQITINDLNSLKYLEATLKEVSRICTIQPLSQPFVSHDCFHLGPNKLHKDSVLVCNYHAIHVDKNVWMNPFEFSPERFLNNCTSECSLQLFNYGFQDGVHKCPADSLSKKIVLLVISNLLQKFDFEIIRYPHCHNDPPQSSYDFLHLPPPFHIKVDVH